MIRKALLILSISFCVFGPLVLPSFAHIQEAQQAAGNVPTELPDLDLIFGGAFMLVARYYGAATFALTEWAKTRLKVTGGFFAYFFAVAFDTALVAATKYGFVTSVLSLLALIGFILPAPSLPDGNLSNVYYIGLLAVSLMVATVKFLKKYGLK